MAFSFIFFVARGCVATQESTQVRKYVTSADSLLGESSSAGNEQLQGALQNAGGDPAKVDVAALSQVANKSKDLYLRALTQEEVPPEFEDAHHYLVSSLGIRYNATRELAEAGSGEGFTAALAAATEDYRLSDGVLRNHYFPAVQDALEEAGQQRDQGYLEEPGSFMDYDQTSFDAVSRAAAGATQDDPNALHGVEISAVEVAGQALYPGGNVVLTGDDEPVFFVTAMNGGEVAETAVPVEVILNTSAERQAHTATIERIAPGGGSATVEVSGFRPGELDETAKVTVEVGPVKYEEYVKNNTLTGTVTFGL